jgi:hypothetical protein
MNHWTMRRSAVTNWGPRRTHFALQRLLQFLKVGFLTTYICVISDFGADLDFSAGWDHPIMKASSSTEGATAYSPLPPKTEFFDFGDVSCIDTD